MEAHFSPEAINSVALVIRPTTKPRHWPLGISIFAKILVLWFRWDVLLLTSFIASSDCFESILFAGEGMSV